MATIGRGLYAPAVHELFEGVRTYDVERAMAVLADGAEFESPWGSATGHDAITKIFESLLTDPASRPSFTIRDISGDGALVQLRVMVSGRFGKAARLHVFHLLHLRGRIHQVRIVSA